MRAAAVTDPAYHRYLMFGLEDEIREQALERPLRPHEAQQHLWGPQLEIIKTLERAIADRNGGVFVIRMSRQTGKNECEAMIEDRALCVWSPVFGSIYIRAAPTWQPQIVNSKMRLEKHLNCDPLIEGKYDKREGYIYECGGAQIQFLSANKQSNVVGATASLALSVDEAHKIDKDKFDEDFAPFTASTNAPTFMWGVAADKQDMLFQYRERVPPEHLLEFPSPIWCELSEAYAKHYAERVQLLGQDHPIIATQYDLIDIDSVGTFLNGAQQASLFAGEHPRLPAPRAGYEYTAIVDVGGESEEDADSEMIRETESGRDSTAIWIVEWDDRDDTLPYRTCRIVTGYWWTGEKHMKQIDNVCRICQAWGVSGGVIDARGVGEPLAMEVQRRFPAVRPYKATLPNVSDDCYDLLARVNTGSVRFWRADPAADAELREAHAQARHTRYEIRGHEQMKLIKPKGAGSAGKHIDMIKALTYLHRAEPMQPFLSLE